MEEIQTKRIYSPNESENEREEIDYPFDRLYTLNERKVKPFSFKHAKRQRTTPVNKNYIEHKIQNELSVCKICETLKENNYQIEACNHTFCLTCIAEYIQFRINEALVTRMPCPDHECNKELNDSEIEKLISKLFFEKYLLFKRNEELSNNPFLRWCPVPDCAGYDIGNLQKSKLTCRACSHKFCYYCTENWHVDDTCKLKNEQEFDEWSRKNGARFCPNCRVKVQKTLGCDHMTCTRCNYEWCWLCGEKYTGGHYLRCPVLRDRKWNKPISRIIAMIFSLVILSTLPIFVFLTAVYQTDIGVSLEAEFLFKCLKKRVFVYLFAIFSGIILIPFYYSLGPIIVGIYLMSKFLKKLDFNKIYRCVLSPPLGLIIAPFIPFVVVFIALCITIIGLMFIVIKIIIVVRRCVNPKYLIINAKYRPVN
jgi:hypothetical protein